MTKAREKAEKVLAEVINNLKNAYSFIYKLGNKYYVIGMNYFRECTSQEIELYNAYRDKWDCIKSLLYDLKTDADVQLLIDSFDKIFAETNKKENELIPINTLIRNEESATDELSKILGDKPEETSQNILRDFQKQCKDRNYVYNFKDGIFYKYNLHKNE